jgi:hypothetical protein
MGLPVVEEQSLKAEWKKTVLNTSLTREIQSHDIIHGEIAWIHPSSSSSHS